MASEKNKDVKIIKKPTAERRGRPKKLNKDDEQDFTNLYGIPTIEKKPITFYVTEDHKLALEELADNKGLTVSTYLRALTLENLHRPIKRYKLVEYYE